MENHLDVLSYLLGAAVFSTGFLSTRLHASADATRREVSDVSWRVRDLLANGERLAPSELGGLLSAAQLGTDRVARLARWLNVAFVGAAFVVFVNGTRLQTSGVDHPPTILLLMVVLVIGAAAVGGVGELDARVVEESLEQDLQRTTVGRLHRLDQAIRRGDATEGRVVLGELRRSFPEWGLLPELEAHLHFIEGHLDTSLDIIEEHVASERETYASVAIGVGAAVSMGDPHRGLVLARRVERTRSLADDELLILRSLRLQAAHLDEMVDGAGGSGRTAIANRGATVAGGALDTLFEAAVEDTGTALDIRTATIPALTELSESFERWNHLAAAATPLPGTPWAMFTALIDGTTGLEADPSLTQRIVSLGDGEAVESLGLGLLLAGEGRAAVTVLERAVALRPKSARIHWAHAMSCWRWGWEDRAEQSLGRAISLDAENWILRLCRRVVVDGTLSAEAVAAAVAQTSGPSTSVKPSERIQLALIGVQVEAAPPTTGRTALVEVLVGRARDLHLATVSERVPNGA